MPTLCIACSSPFMAALCSKRQLASVASVILQLHGSVVTQCDGTRRTDSGAACSEGGELGAGAREPQPDSSSAGSSNEQGALA